MNIGAIGINALLSLNSRANARESDASAFAEIAQAPANSAASQSILPSREPMRLSFENILALQSLDEPKAVKAPTATDIFLEEARKHPMERMREQIMQELGVSEADLAALPPDERRAMEDKIREMIEEKFRQGMNNGDAPPETNAQMLQTLV